MKILSGKQVAIHSLHETIESIAGSVGTGMVVGHAEGSGLGSKLFDFLAHEIRQPVRLFGPFGETTQSLAERGFRGGVIALPEPLGYGAQQCSKLEFRSIAELDVHMQKARDQENGGK